MKKFTLMLVFLLATISASYGQVAYDYGWETGGLGGWTSSDFSTTSTDPCTGATSVRGNVWEFSQNHVLTSPNLGTSNGGVVTLNFDYKVLNYPGDSATPANQVQIIGEWASSLTGTWVQIGFIGEADHTASLTCATKSFEFSPTSGSVFVRFKFNYINGTDAYHYIDNINVTQGVAPSCVSPSNLVASSVTSASATVSWNAPTTVPNAGYQYYYSSVNEVPTVAGTPTNDLTIDLASLTPNTNYYFWVRSMCGTESSVWSGPLVFRTLCVPFGDFFEDFNTATVGTGLVPSCWTKTIVSANTGVNVSVINGNFASAPNAVLMTNVSDLNAGIYLVSPSLTALSSSSHRLIFKARSGGNGYPLVIGTMTNPTDASTFVALQTYNLTTTYTTYSFAFNAATTANFIAFKHGQGGTYRNLYIDDVLWEPIPTVVPDCVGPITIAINEGCGNFPTTLSWAAVPGADGYKISISTTENGTNLVSVPNINNALTYSFSGNVSTQYFYKVTPYNVNGDATNCPSTPANSFVTFSDGCYCPAVPQQIDGNGVSNILVGDSNFPVAAVGYSDLTTLSAASITQGLNTIMGVTHETGFTYATNVWVDFNDDFNFDPSELVFTGADIPTPAGTVVTTSFVTPLNAPIGTHRMRMVTTDNYQSPAEPCFNNFYGVVVDLLVDVLPAPSCLPPSSISTANITSSAVTLNWTSSSTKFFVEVVFANEAQGGGIVTEVNNALTVTLNGLDAQTDYAYYIQSDCGNGLSPWSGPFLFRTACPSVGSFVENFTTATNITVPECWKTLINSTSGGPSISVSSFNEYVALSNSDNAAAKLYLITPSLTDLPLNTHRIKFKARGPVGTNLIVGTMSDPGNESTFTASQTIPMTTVLSDYAVGFVSSTTNKYVAFKYMGTNTYQTAVIDNVIWEVAPSCPDISVVTFNGATPYTADISWYAGGSETAWQYAVGASTLTDPTSLTPVDVAGTTPQTIIPGLAPSTTYKVWIRAKCGSEFGIWSPAKTFTTACVAVSQFPWAEGFEGLTAVNSTTFPPCWSKENGDYSTANTGTTSNTQPRTGSKYLRNVWNAINEYMWTPGFELTAGVSYDFSFFMQGDGYTSWNVDVFQNTIQNSVGATQVGVTNTPSGTGGLSIQPYMLVSNTIIPTTTGIYYFAIRVNELTGDPYSIGFDDFRMEPTPTCIAPAAPNATDVTTITATMNWTATTPAPAGGYDYYRTSDLVMTPNATTTPTGTVGAGILTANLVDLVGSTVYNIFVRSICGANDKSSWSYSGSFTTECVNAVLPYSINFENATVPNLPLCTTSENAGTGNNWKTMNSLTNGFTTRVLNYSYHPSNPANAWFYTNTMTLVGGTTYSVSYNYGNSGSFVESMKIAYGSTGNATAMTNVIIDHPEVSGSALIANTATFTPVTSGDYVIGFNAYSAADKNQLYLDNILIQVALGTTDFDKNSFTAYPNPVKDMLNVSFTQNITNVAVYNLLGQQVLLKNVNANKGQIDMSNLASGTYLVKVNADNAVKTIKVIKQ